MSAPPPLPPPSSSSLGDGEIGPLTNGHGGGSFSSSSSSEIVEEELVTEEVTRGLRLPSIREGICEGLSSYTASLNGEDNVYVAVGKSESSMSALSWALRNTISSPATVIVLIHVFPETHSIPYPLGKIPKSQASQEQIETHVAQERGRRREFLHKFISACSDAKVKVETVLVESDIVAKAITDLVPILNIRKLVLGISKSSARKLKSRKGSTIAEKVLKSSAVDTCDVRVICEGKEVNLESMIESPSPRGNAGADDFRSSQQENQSSDSPRRKEQFMVDPFACSCFKPKTKS